MNVNKYIAKADERKERWGFKTSYRISEVYDELGIFDWWNEWLSVTQLKQMKSFLEKAISLGYTGYVCFKVGAKYCAHGMWAHKNESTNGYSPDGACLFHSFRSGDNYWDCCNENGEWIGVREHCEFPWKEIKEIAKGC